MAAAFEDARGALPDDDFTMMEHGAIVENKAAGDGDIVENKAAEGEAIVEHNAAVENKEAIVEKLVWQWQELTVTKCMGWVDMDKSVCAELNTAMAGFKKAGGDFKLQTVYTVGKRTWRADLQSMTQTRIWPDGSEGATSNIRQIAVL